MIDFKNITNVNYVLYTSNFFFNIENKKRTWRGHDNSNNVIEIKKNIFGKYEIKYNSNLLKSKIKTIEEIYKIVIDTQQ